MKIRRVWHPFGHLLTSPTLIAEVERMTAKFDIFLKLPDGQPIWIIAVETLEEAKRQLRRIAATAPGDYFIFDPGDGQVMTA